jgi:hypothetical protein
VSYLYGPRIELPCAKKKEGPRVFLSPGAGPHAHAGSRRAHWESKGRCEGGRKGRRGGSVEIPGSDIGGKIAIAPPSFCFHCLLIPAQPAPPAPPPLFGDSRGLRDSATPPQPRRHCASRSWTSDLVQRGSSLELEEEEEGTFARKYTQLRGGSAGSLRPRSLRSGPLLTG